MPTASYAARRAEVGHYFDRTAAQAWARLTSDAPVSGIRATVRAGRDRMRATLLGWLPADMAGLRLLDAGCGTGALAVAAAARGAEVLAVDLSPTLLDTARERSAGTPNLTFLPGDMLGEEHGSFDHVAAMDSLIHYRGPDIAAALARLAPRVRRSVVFTVAPRTKLLAAMHLAGRLFPRADRAPAIEPLEPVKLRALLAEALPGFRPGRDARVDTGFYKSHAFEWVRR